MSLNTKQASNATGLALAKEVSPGILPAVPAWIGQEPNTYKDFGGDFKTIARNPINPSRQRKKGVLVDLDASGGWQEDMTYEALTDKVEGLMYAAFREKIGVAATDAAGNDFTVASSANVYTGDVVFVTGFANAANNGAKHVMGTAAGHITVAEALTNEAGATGKLYRVGRVFAADDVSYDAPSKTLHSTAGNFTTIGLIPGEYVYMSADVGAANLGANVGIARVKSVTVNTLVFDKVRAADPDAPIITANGVGKSAAIYFASRVIKNEKGALIKRTTYQAERTLGMAETTSANAQAEYLTGAIVNEGHFVFNTADKVTVDWSLVASKYEARTSAEGPKPGTRPVSRESSAFNTSTDVRSMNISLVGSDDPQFAYVMDAALTVKNNNKANKAVGVLGSIDHTEGLFAVSAAVTAYFSTVEAAKAVADNADVTVDLFVARDNRGMVFDLPLVSLGDGRPKITANEPIQLPLNIEAATAAKLSSDMDHTLMISFFDYLPNVATA